MASRNSRRVILGNGAWRILTAAGDERQHLRGFEVFDDLLQDHRDFGRFADFLDAIVVTRPPSARTNLIELDPMSRQSVPRPSA